MSEQKIKLLLIEDDPGDADLLEEILFEKDESSFILEWAQRLGEGLARLEQGGIDLVLLDLSLPDSEGFETFRRVNSQAPELPIVVLSGLDDERMAIKAVQQGAQDYLVKGDVDHRLLRRALQYAIERKQAEVEIYRLNAELEQRVIKRTAQLEAANRALEAFAYSVSHDLRTPLRAIKGFSEIIARRHQSSLKAEGLRYFNHIIQASSQMEQLINDLLDYSRLGQQAVRREPLPLHQLLVEVLNHLGERIQDALAQVNLPSANDLPVINSNWTLLRQIFINLLDNAITYRRPDMPLELVIGCQDKIESAGTQQIKQIIISVSDNGIGIPAKSHDSIFNIFQRLHTQEERGGTGIGLANVKKSVELLGGKVWVESIIGKGSTFYVKLPNKPS
jgi:signal transduction histidine kinase